MLHEDELAIDDALVRALVDDTLPDLAGRPLARLAVSGSSNALFRLGDDLLVRLPRQPGGSETIAKESRWLPFLAPALPVAVPEIVAVGPPGHGYPEHWSVVRWIDGNLPPVPPAPGSTDALARDLAAFVAVLRDRPVPPGALADPSLRWYRGEPLPALDGATRQAIADCAARPGLALDLDACRRIWDDAMSEPAAVPEPRWLHADLLAENILVRDGRLRAVLDFGALTVGDPTVDLVVAWELLDESGRDIFRAHLAVDDAQWRRGRAWALAIALMTFGYYWHTMPARCADRLVMARAVLADARVG
ncbi:MAG TPA: aminoglycoside phosphotransferase family protein [Jatrophihabitans sp.]|jgi:aminoglycoside phosphotransferase (APT) family kinase protein|uniref:aminoglycoside phosphotransferase family protein n=1 Tax=Jatrophihabitans sp. TaxID=1932789 RepID=UPI002E022B1F|nr:aminoglycoside phosphotransferase family protein [Jatrophihabitans sp.]